MANILPFKDGSHFKSAAKFLLETVSAYRPCHRDALEIIRSERRTVHFPVTPEPWHLRNAIAWLKRAQDATGSGGVSWGYRTRTAVRSGDRLGWMGAYPETTGYIIPTMLRYAKWAGDDQAALAAHRMADWELSIQLPDGGFQGGIYGSHPVSSSTFVTGQVLFGLLETYKACGIIEYLDAAIRAGDFLLSCLDDTGRFVKGYSHFCEAGPKVYEVRTGLALAELGTLLDRNCYMEAAIHIARYTLSCQQLNGWFGGNDLHSHEKRLTHTLGYVLEGLCGIGLLLNQPNCLVAAKRTLDKLATLIDRNGFLAGRWHHDWTPAANWACLTGSVQIAGVLLRMHRQMERSYWEAGRKLLSFVCWTQQMESHSSGISGGIRGSFPFGGEYGRWCILNWATKFFADTLMDYFELDPAKAAAGA